MKTLFYYLFVHQGVINLEKTPLTHRETRKKTMEEEIKKRFEVITTNVNNSKNFRCLLRELKVSALEDILYNNHEDTLQSNKNSPFPSDDEIIKKFQGLDEKYKYFPKEEQSKEHFISFFKACKLVADYEEFNNTNNNEAAYLHAYKMMVLFGVKNKNSVFDFTENFISQNKGNYSKPIHDLLVNDIPVNEPPMTLLKWQNLIRESGKNGLKIFQTAPAIEELLKHAPPNLGEAQETMSKLSYKRFKENPELARLCLEYNVNETVFNKCLSIKPKEKSDNLPQISINGKTIGHPGYHLVKLPIDDPRAYILGKITNCCQSIGGDSEECVIDGITRKNNGFYVLLKSKKDEEGKTLFTDKKQINYKEYEIVGQSYAWLGLWGNLTFDSWENLTPDVDNNIIVPFLKEFTTKSLEENKNILRVTIGIGGKTPKQFKTKLVSVPETMKEGVQYGDSKSQYLIGMNDEVVTKLSKALEEDLEILMNKEIKIDLVSKKQEEWIRELFIKHYKHYNEIIEDYEQVINQSVNNVNILGIYYFLHQSKILTNENIKYVIKNCGSSVYKLFVLLNKNNPDLIKIAFILLVQAGGDMNALSRGLFKISESEPKLLRNEKVINLLKKAADKEEIANILLMLDKINPDFILDEEITIPLTDKISLENTSIGLRVLFESKPELVTKKNIAVFVNSSDNVAKALIYLIRNNLTLFNDKSIVELLEKAPHQAKLIASTACQLYKLVPDLATDKNIIELFEKANYLPTQILFLLKNLYQENPELINSNTVKLLIKSCNYPNSASNVSGLVEILLLSYRFNKKLVADNNFLQALHDNASSLSPSYTTLALSKLVRCDWATQDDIVAVIGAGSNAQQMFSYLKQLHSVSLYTTKNIDTVQKLLDQGKKDSDIFKEVFSTELTGKLEKDINFIMNKEIKIELVSTEQALWMRELFIEQYENYSKTTENYDQLINQSVNNLRILKLYYILHQNKILTDEYIKCITKAFDNAPSVVEVLFYLYRENIELLRNKNIVELLGKVPHHAELVASTVCYLYKLSPELVNNKDIIELFEKANYLSPDITRWLTDLYRQTPELINSNTIKLLIKAINCSDHAAYQLVQILIFIDSTYKELMLDNDFIQSLSLHDDIPGLHSALENFMGYNCERVTKDAVMAVVSADKNALTMYFILTELQNSNLCTLKNIDVAQKLLTQGVQQTDIIKEISRMKKTETSLINLSIFTENKEEGTSSETSLKPNTP